MKINRDAIVMAAGFGILLFSLIAGLYGHLTVLWVGFLGSTCLIFTANLDRISEFRASKAGIEAKTRDVIRRAEVTIDELQDLAKIIGKSTLSLIKRSNRIGGFGVDQEEATLKEILEVLSRLNVSEQEQENILQDWHYFVELDYARGILGNGHRPGGTFSNDFDREWKRILRMNPPPSPSNLQMFLERWGLLSDEHQELIADYEYYRENRKHRRYSVWRNHHNWPKLKADH